MRAVEQYFAETLPESLRGKIPFEPAAMTDGNRSRLLRDHNRNGVRFLRNAERGPVPQTKTAIERLALAHGKNTGRGRDPAVAQDHSAIVERRFWMK